MQEMVSSSLQHTECYDVSICMDVCKTCVFSAKSVEMKLCKYVLKNHLIVHDRIGYKRDIWGYSSMTWTWCMTSVHNLLGCWLLRTIPNHLFCCSRKKPAVDCGMASFSRQARSFIVSEGVTSTINTSSDYNICSLHFF